MPITIPDETRTDYLEEIVTGKRIVVYNDIPYVLLHPTQEQLLSAKVCYTQAFTEYRKMKMPTRMEARITLSQALQDAGKDPGIIERRENMMKSIGVRINETIAQEKIQDYLKSPHGLEKAFNEFMDVMTEDERSVLMEAAEQAQLQETILSNTAEALAEQQKDMFLLTCCIRDSKGHPIWPTYDMICMDTNSDRILFFREQLALFWGGQPSQFEGEFMKQAAELLEDKEKNV